MVKAVFFVLMLAAGAVLLTSIAGYAVCTLDQVSSAVTLAGR